MAPPLDIEKGTGVEEEGRVHFSLGQQPSVTNHPLIIEASNSGVVVSTRPTPARCSGFLQGLFPRGAAAFNASARMGARVVREDGLASEELPTSQNVTVWDLRSGRCPHGAVMVGGLLPKDGLARMFGHLKGLARMIGHLDLARMVDGLLPDGLFPQSSLGFTILLLFAFVEIRSQGQDYPFITHRNLFLAGVGCVLMFFFASGADHIATPFVDQHPNFKVIARTVRILCLFLIVVILALLACS